MPPPRCRCHRHRRDKGDARRFPIDQRRQIELPFDRGSLLDIQTMTFSVLPVWRVTRWSQAAPRPPWPRRPRLDQLRRHRPCRAAGVNMPLTTSPASRDRSRVHRPLRPSTSVPTHQPHAELPQHRLALVFVDVHAGFPRLKACPQHSERKQPSIKAVPLIVDPSDDAGFGADHLARLGTIFSQASTKVAPPRPFLDILRSAPLSSISTMRSTPLEPITTGRRHRILIPYSPLDSSASQYGFLPSDSFPPWRQRRPPAHRTPSRSSGG